MNENTYSKEQNNEQISEIDMLCLGAVCHLMLFFANKRFNEKALKDNKIIQQNDKEKQPDNEGMFQGILVSRYVSCIGNEGVCLLHADKKRNMDKDIIVGNGNDSSIISDIMTGSKRFRLKESSYNPSIDDGVENFKNVSTSWFDNEDKPLLMLSLFDIIKKDAYIRSDGIECYKKFIYQSNGIYSFPKFMIGVLLYVASNDNKDKKGAEKACVERIRNTLSNQKGPRRYSLENKNSLLVKHVNLLNDHFPEGSYIWLKESQTLIFDDDDIRQSISPSQLTNGNYVAPDFDTDADSENDRLWLEETTRNFEILSAKFDEIRKSREDTKKEVFNSSDEFSICRFCKKFVQIPTFSSVGGRCSITKSLVLVDDKCECYERNKKYIKMLNRRKKKK